MDKDCNYNLSYNTIDIFKLFMAFVVVAIHTTDYETFESPFANDLLQYVKCFAVPFFFAVSGYFLYTKLAALPLENHDEEYNKAIRKTLKMYVFWSLIYLPINIYGEYFEWGHTSPFVIISSLVRGWLFVGQNYGSWIMWYILAYIVALVIIKYLHHVFNYKTIIGFSVLMLVVGWLYFYNHDTFSIALYDNLFKGTRNGFFWGFPCVCAGFVVSMLIENLRNTKGLTLLLTMAMVIAMFYVPTSHRQLLYPIMGGVILMVGLLLPIHSDSSIYLYVRKTSGMIYFTHLIPTLVLNGLFGIVDGSRLFVYVSCCSLMIAVLKIYLTNLYKSHFNLK